MLSVSMTTPALRACAAARLAASTPRLSGPRVMTARTTPWAMSATRTGPARARPMDVQSQALARQATHKMAKPVSPSTRRSACPATMVNPTPWATPAMVLEAAWVRPSAVLPHRPVRPATPRTTVSAPPITPTSVPRVMTGWSRPRPTCVTARAAVRARPTCVQLLPLASPSISRTGAVASRDTPPWASPAMTVWPRPWRTHAMARGPARAHLINALLRPPAHRATPKTESGVRRTTRARGPCATMEIRPHSPMCVTAPERVRGLRLVAHRARCAHRAIPRMAAVAPPITLTSGRGVTTGSPAPRTTCAVALECVLARATCAPPRRLARPVTPRTESAVRPTTLERAPPVTTG